MLGLWVVSLALRQRRPQLPYELVGDGDQGLLIADPSVEHDDPLLQTSQLFREARRCFRSVAARWRFRLW